MNAGLGFRFAAVLFFAGLFAARRLAVDLAIVALRLPATFSREVFMRELNTVRGQLARRLAPPPKPAVPVPVARLAAAPPPPQPALVQG